MTDAVNLNQLASASAATLSSANAYTDNQVAAVRFDLNQLQRQMRSGIADSDAIIGIPQNAEPGRVSIGVGMSGYGGAVGFAAGISATLPDGRTSFRMSAAGASQGGSIHVSGGAAFSF